MHWTQEKESTTTTQRWKARHLYSLAGTAYTRKASRALPRRLPYSCTSRHRFEHYQILLTQHSSTTSRWMAAMSLVSGESDFGEEVLQYLEIYVYHLPLYQAQCPASTLKSLAVIYELPSLSMKTTLLPYSSTVDIRPNILPSGHNVCNSGCSVNVGIVIGVMMYPGLKVLTRIG